MGTREAEIPECHRLRQRIENMQNLFLWRMRKMKGKGDMEGKCKCLCAAEVVMRDRDSAVVAEVKGGI